MWHYLYFIVLVKVKDPTEYTGPESYVAQMIVVSQFGHMPYEMERCSLQLAENIFFPLSEQQEASTCIFKDIFTCLSLQQSPVLNIIKKMKAQAIVSSLSFVLSCSVVSAAWLAKPGAEEHAS